MITLNKPQPENLSTINVNPITAKVATPASVVCFTTAQKNKKLIEAKKKVYQASANLNW